MTGAKRKETSAGGAEDGQNAPETKKGRRSGQASILGPELNYLVENDKTLTKIRDQAIRDKISRPEANDDLQAKLKQSLNSAFCRENSVKSMCVAREKGADDHDEIESAAEKINKYIKERVGNNEASKRSREKKTVEYEEKISVLKADLERAKKENDDLKSQMQDLKAEMEREKAENQDLKSKVRKLEFNQTFADEVAKEGEDLTLDEELGEGWLAALLKDNRILGPDQAILVTPVDTTSEIVHTTNVQVEGAAAAVAPVDAATKTDAFSMMGQGKKFPSHDQLRGEQNGSDGGKDKPEERMSLQGGASPRGPGLG